MSHTSIPHASDTRTAARGAGDLRVAGLTVTLGGRVVLDGLDLEVATGTTVALLGASGCGKTTLLRTVAGLQRADDGLVRVGGEVLTAPGGAHVPPERRRIGMVFQDWALFPHLSVADNVAFGVARMPRGARADVVRRVLDMVDLHGYDHRMPATLSGGQQQRVALARALATGPRLLLLDEPFSNLDAGLRVQVRSEVARLLRQLGITTVIVTHDQEEAFLLGDEVAVMVAGTVQQQAAPADLYAAPATRAVAEFLGDANLLPGTAEGRVAHTVVGPVPLAATASGAVRVLVRPEHLHMDKGDDAHVAAVEYFGHDALSRLERADGQPVVVRTMSMPPYRAGDGVAVRYVGPPTVAYTE